MKLVPPGLGHSGCGPQSPVAAAWKPLPPTHLLPLLFHSGENSPSPALRRPRPAPARPGPAPARPPPLNVSSGLSPSSRPLGRLLDVLVSPSPVCLPPLCSSFSNLMVFLSLAALQAPSWAWSVLGSTSLASSLPQFRGFPCAQAPGSRPLCRPLGRSADLPGHFLGSSLGRCSAE